ncbi:unknown [Fusobacterium sp. CAG:815]|nr:unknown [Fusobacterium sp. CAG:815]
MLFIPSHLRGGGLGTLVEPAKNEPYKTNPNGTTTSYDKYGRKTGSFKTDSTGRTTQYDRYGRKVGSFK